MHRAGAAGRDATRKAACDSDGRRPPIPDSKRQPIPIEGDHPADGSRQPSAKWRSGGLARSSLAMALGKWRSS